MARVRVYENVEYVADNELRVDWTIREETFDGEVLHKGSSTFVVLGTDDRSDKVNEIRESVDAAARAANQTRLVYELLVAEIGVASSALTEIF